MAASTAKRQVKPQAQMADLAPRLTLPQTPRKYRFVLTPLADAMFQLLIFFMLSSSLAPYALLKIRSGAEGNFANTPGTPADQTATTFGDVAIWNVAAEGVTVGGQRFDFASLPALAAALTDRETTILLLLRDSAVVQDLARVIEVLSAAGITNVQIAGNTP